jgi:hypothetical protein
MKPDTGYFAMLNIENGKTHIVGKAAGDDTVFINGVANETKNLPDDTIRVRVTDKNPENDRDEYETVIAFYREHSIQNEIPILITDENKISYPKNQPTDFTFGAIDINPNAKIKAIIDRDNTDFLGYFDYNMDSTPELVIREKDTKIYSETGELIFTFPSPKNNVIVWYVSQNINGEIIGSVEGYDYIIKNGKPVSYSGDGPEGVIWRENIVYYTLGVTDYSDEEYASGKAKVDVYRLLSQAKYLEPERNGNGYFALLNKHHGITQIVGISSIIDGIFVNGNLVPFSDNNGTIDFYIAPEFDSDPERGEDTLILVTSGYGGNTVHTEVPVFITDDDYIALPSGDYGFGNYFHVEDGYISITAIGSNFQPSGLFPSSWLGHAVTLEEYFFYRKGDELIEYGAIDFPLEKFKKMRGSEAVLKRISDDEMTITNILYRGNNYVNINCTKEEGGEIWCYYYAYSLNDKNEIELDSLVTQHGKYYPSILEENGIYTVEYPENLPV